jgi:hypothetical protein
MSRGRHQFFFLTLSNLHYPRELIHDAVCLSLCRTLHLKSDDWMLHSILDSIRPIVGSSSSMTMNHPYRHKSSYHL